MTGGTLAARLLQVPISITIARALGQETFGAYGVVQTTVVMLGTAAGFGLGTTASRYVAYYQELDKQRVGQLLAMCSLLSLIFSGLLGVTLVVVAPWVASNLLADPGLVASLRISAGTLVFTSQSGALTGALAGFQHFRGIARMNLVSALIGLPIVVLGAVYWGLEGAVLGQAISSATGCLIIARGLQKTARAKGVSFNLSNSVQEISVLWRFSLPSALASVVVGTVPWLCILIIVNQDNGYAEIALISAARQWQVPTLFLAGIFAQCTLPAMSAKLGGNRKASVKELMRSAFMLTLFTSLPIVILLSLFSGPIMGWYGTGFRRGAWVFILLQMASFTQAILSPWTVLLQASGQAWAHFFLNATYGISLLLITWELRELRAEGLAAAALLAVVIYALPLFLATRSLKRDSSDISITTAQV